MKVKRKVKVKAKSYDIHIPEELEPFCIPLSSVKLWEGNPRKNDEAVKPLADLIKEHGFTKPIVIWKKNMVTYAGNTATKAARLLGMKVIPAIVRDFTSESAAIAYGISDNKAGEFSTWDDEVLGRLLSVETFKGIDLGFSEDELNYLNLAKVEEVNEQEEWIGMPDFDAVDASLKIVIHFKSKEERVLFSKKNNMKFSKQEAKTWSTWWPYREREDLSSLKYEEE